MKIAEARLRELADLLGDIMGACGAVTAPFSIAVNLRGYEQLIMDIMEDREFVDRLMEFCTRLAAGFGQIQLKNGAMATSIIDASKYSFIPCISKHFL